MREAPGSFQAGAALLAEGGDPTSELTSTNEMSNGMMRHSDAQPIQGLLGSFLPGLEG